MYTRTKKLTNPAYSPTDPSSESDIRSQVDGSIQEAFDLLESTYATKEDLTDVIVGQIPEGTVVRQSDFDIHLADNAAHNIGSNFSLIQRDILRMKMRQTGLNLDPNAWSDSMEDMTGVNTSLSSVFTFDSTNKSFKVADYNVMYYADSLPQSSTPSWTKTAGGTATESISSGRLIIGGNAADDEIYTRETGLVVAAKTKEVKFKAKVVSGTTYCLYVSISDGARSASLQFTAGGVIKYYNGSTYTNIATSQPLTSDFTCLLTVNNSSGLSVSINGSSVGTVAYASLATTATNGISFGGSGSGVNTWSCEFDYFYYALDTTAKPTTSTIIWNAVTSEGTLTKAIIEAIQNLGTGTITYYISRDNGTTFTQCTLDTVTSISIQPTGTSIVLKVVITGNAELLAVAWGGTT